MKISTIIFDLDGTLIDSSDSILAAFKGSFDALGLTPFRTLAPEIVGPPLRETLALLSGSDDSVLLDRLAAAFKESYDTDGYRQTTVFPGVREMLSTLLAWKVPLYIATNKRIKPTELIVEYLGWSECFSGVFSLDAVQPVAASKGELLNHLVGKYRMCTATTLYVGDRVEDEFAARQAKIDFVYASWGYGEDRQPGSCANAQFPDELIKLLDVP